MTVRGLITAIQITLFSASVTIAANPRAMNYIIDVTFEPQNSFMQASSLITLDSTSVPSDTIVFYLHGELSVDSLLLDGKPVSFNQTSVFYYDDYSLIATRVSFYGKTDRFSRLAIFYEGYFHRSSARSPSDYMRIDPDGVFLRSYGYSLWFPVLLESRSDSYKTDFSDVTIHTPAEYVPVFVGKRLSEEVRQGQRISRWRALQFDLFSAQCTAQKSVVSGRGDFYLYHYDDSLSTVRAKDILAFVEILAGKFGKNYNKNAAIGPLYIMEMPQYGDISSANVTGITSDIWRNFDKNDWYRRGLAHELVHPFVQTDIKRTDSLYALEIEGFPSYLHLPVLAGIMGQEWYEKIMQAAENDYLVKKKTGLDLYDRPVPPEKPLTRISADEIGDYKDVFVLDDRALLFLNWLYRELGEDRFFEFTSGIFNAGTLTFDSFQRLILKYLPDAGDDINIWLCTMEYPPRFYINKNR